MLQTEHKKKINWERVVNILIIVQSLLSITVCVMVLTLGVIPVKYIALLAAVLAVPVVLEILTIKFNTGMVMGSILAVVMTICLVLGGFYIYKTGHTLNSISGANTEKFGVNVYVLKSDPAKSIEDAKDYTFGILKTLDRSNTDSTVEKINDKLGGNIKTTEYDGVFELIDALMDGKVKAIIVNQGCINITNDSEGYKDTESKIRIIYSNEIKKDVERPGFSTNPQDKDITERNFIVYLSGIDTRGSEIINTRSDVNILMVVNPVDKKILLVNTPRDYYVPLSISNGVRDKLTHAGIYGTEVSMDTLEMLYGVNIDYYVKVNFSSFVKIIDALGGIEVNSDYSFTAGGFRYNKGVNKLNGTQALAFARERYSFSEGDRQRGRNQMAVISAVIDKITSPYVLKNYASLMDGIKGCMQTSLSSEDIGKLARMQLGDMARWEITSVSANGNGDLKTTYSNPGFTAYVMIPDQSTIDGAKAQIKAVMGE